MSNAHNPISLACVPPYVIATSTPSQGLEFSIQADLRSLSDAKRAELDQAIAESSGVFRDYFQGQPGFMTGEAWLRGLSDASREDEGLHVFKDVVAQSMHVEQFRKWSIHFDHHRHPIFWGSEKALRRFPGVNANSAHVNKSAYLDADQMTRAVLFRLLLNLRQLAPNVSLHSLVDVENIDGEKLISLQEFGFPDLKRKVGDRTVSYAIADPDGQLRDVVRAARHSNQLLLNRGKADPVPNDALLALYSVLINNTRSEMLLISGHEVRQSTATRPYAKVIKDWAQPSDVHECLKSLLSTQRAFDANGVQANKVFLGRYHSPHERWSTGGFNESGIRSDIFGHQIGPDLVALAIREIDNLSPIAVAAKEPLGYVSVAPTDDGELQITGYSPQRSSLEGRGVQALPVRPLSELMPSLSAFQSNALPTPDASSIFVVVQPADGTCAVYGPLDDACADEVVDALSQSNDPWSLRALDADQPQQLTRPVIQG